MKDIIKKVRQAAGLSQQDFAAAMSASFTSVNRWENDRSLPNQMAQMNLYKFCAEHEIPLIDFIHEKIQAAVSNIENNLTADGEGDRKILFHGSKSGLKGRIAPISRDKCDFGRGFYMGTEPDQPLTLISDFDQSKFYVVSVSLSALEKLNVQPDLDWAMIVAYNRGKMERINGTALYKKYAGMAEGKDIVIGSIANDRMFYVLDNFFLGNITDKALIMSLSALQLGEQYVAVTQRACDAVRIEKEIEFSYMERKCFHDVSEANRGKGIRLANDICKNYRRDGLFFDEILDRAGEEAQHGSYSIKTL